MSTNTEPGKVESFIDDMTITTKIKAKYLADDLVSADVSVTTDKGVVTLDGTVSSQAAYDQAIKIAENISGVKEVKANLQVNADSSY